MPNGARIPHAQPCQQDFAPIIWEECREHEKARLMRGCRSHDAARTACKAHTQSDSSQTKGLSYEQLPGYSDTTPGDICWCANTWLCFPILKPKYKEILTGDK